MLANMLYTTGMINGNKANNQYNPIQVHTTMKYTKGYQKAQLRALAAKVKQRASMIETCSDEDITYSLHWLASDLKDLKEEMTALENYAITLAFAAVHNNEKQEA